MSSFLGLENLQTRTASNVSEEAYLDSYIKFEESASACGEALEVGKQLFDTAIKVVEINKVARKYGQSKSLEALVGCEFLNNRVSMEGDDADRTLWQKIKDWFVDMWHKIQDFFMSFSLIAKRCQAKITQMISNFSSLGGKYFDNEKLENTDKKCLSTKQFDATAKELEDAQKISDSLVSLVNTAMQDGGTPAKAFGESSKDYDPSEANIKPDFELKNLKSIEEATDLLKRHYTLLDLVIKYKMIVPKAFKSAADAIKVNKEGDERGRSLHIARTQAHNLMKSIHSVSKLTVRSANALLWACSVCYKAGRKDA